jgi:putative PIN family toxin of toxin-antitoxin system
MAFAATRRKARIFVDSSVMIAASISATGRARDLLRAAIRGELEVWLSEYVLQETQRNLAKKAPAALLDFRDLVQAVGLVQSRYLVIPTRRAVERAARIVNAKDAPIVAAAAACKADYLATYDRKDLLDKNQEILRHCAVKVVTPDAALEGA